MIIKGSRYSETIETRNDETKSIAVNTEFTTDTYYSIVTYQNETFSSLASSYLKNPTMYWKIADINKSLGYPDTIPSGTVVNIPMK